MRFDESLTAIDAYDPQGARELLRQAGKKISPSRCAFRIATIR